MRQERLLLDAPDVVRTAVSPEYVSGWGMVQALREIIQEMVDVRRAYGCRSGLRYSGSRVVVWDEGPGLKRSDLALGNSGKKGDARLIGQFGEGLKLAALVAARNGREMSVETVGFTARPFIGRDPVLYCDVLAFEVRPNGREVGTRVTVEATAEEFEAAKSMFLDFGRRKASGADARVFLPGGRVYVNGCLAAESGELFFSYDLPGSAKAAQNRDRSTLDFEALASEISEALGRLSKIDLIKALLETVKEAVPCLEHNVRVRCDARVRPAWVRAAREVFGPKACRAEGTEADQEAKRLGFTVVHGCPWRWEGLFADLGILPSSTAVAGRGRRAKPVKPTPEERRVLAWAKRVVRKHLADPGKVRVAEDLSLVCGHHSAEAMGLWDPRTQTIWVRRAALQDPRAVLGTLFHETLHKVSGAPDCTGRFEAAWQELVVNMVLTGRRRARGSAGEGLKDAVASSPCLLR
ncbi:MAG: hypothetical protein ACPLRW_06625 [Moorellales bacterium]